MFGHFLVTNTSKIQGRPEQLLFLRVWASIEFDKTYFEGSHNVKNTVLRMGLPGYQNSPTVQGRLFIVLKVP